MIYRTILYTGCLLYLLAAGEKYDKFTKKIPVNGEQTVEVNIEFNTGKLRIEPTDEDVILDGTFRYKKTEPEIDYRDGILDISAGKNEHKKEINITLNSFSDIKENEWRLKFGKNISYKIHLEMGATEASLNFGQIKVQNLNIESGASKTEIRFNEPNPVVLENFDIEAGVSKFTVFDLLNANFKRMNFQGGVGDYELFFTGTILRPAYIKADISVGSLSIYIPKSVPYHVDCDKSMFCSFSVDNAYQNDDNSWYSENFKDSETFLDFDLDTGVGIVSVQRIKN